MSLVVNFENEVQRRVQEELKRIEDYRDQRFKQLLEQRLEQYKQQRRQEREQREQERQQRLEKERPEKERKREEERKQRLKEKRLREKRIRVSLYNQIRKEQAERNRMLISKKISYTEFLKDVKALIDSLEKDLVENKQISCVKKASLELIIKTLELLHKIIPKVLKGSTK